VSFAHADTAMALRARLRSVLTIRLGIGLVAVCSLCAGLLYLSQHTSAPPDAEFGIDEVAIADDQVLDVVPEVVPRPAAPAREHAVAQAEQLLSSFGGMLADSSPSGDLDVDLFSAPIDLDADVLSLGNLEQALSGFGHMRLAWAGDMPDAQFMRGGPVGSGWRAGLGGFGSGHGGGGAMGGNAPRDRRDENQNANSGGQNGIASNTTDQSNGSASNTPGQNGPNTPGPNAPGHTGGPGTGGDGRSNSGPNDGPRTGGPGGAPGRVTGPGATTLQVPEPSVLLLVGIGLTTLVTRRRRSES
jgi:hypothetical protein